MFLIKQDIKKHDKYLHSHHPELTNFDISFICITRVCVCVFVNFLKSITGRVVVPHRSTVLFQPLPWIGKVSL